MTPERTTAPSIERAELVRLAHVADRGWVGRGWLERDPVFVLPKVGGTFETTTDRRVRDVLHLRRADDPVVVIVSDSKEPDHD